MIINLDINGNVKTTSYGYEVGVYNNPIIYFRIHDGMYKLDHYKFNKLILEVSHSYEYNIDVINLDRANLKEVNGEYLVEWKIPSDYLSKLEKLKISPSVNIQNVTRAVASFDLIIFRKKDTASNSILNAIKYFNEVYGEYLIRIKRDQLGSPNGIVPLDENGNVSRDYLPIELSDHAIMTMYDTISIIDHIHGLRINRLDYEFEYYDTDDEEWYPANSIHGGRFGYSNKESPYYDVFGGYFKYEEIRDIDGMYLGDSLTDAYDGGDFTDDITESAHGGTFV